jgi:hypothetical protein
MWPEVPAGFKYLKRVAALLSNPAGLTGRPVGKQLQRRRDARTRQRRFRLDPEAYLRDLEPQFIQLPLLA